MQAVSYTRRKELHALRLNGHEKKKRYIVRGVFTKVGYERPYCSETNIDNHICLLIFVTIGYFFAFRAAGFRGRYGWLLAC